MSSLLEVLEEWVQRNIKAHHHLIVAYSGGRDSHVLLDILHSLRETYHFLLSAIHVNHHLHEKSTAWAAHCLAICEKYQIPLTTVDLKLAIAKGESIEQEARIHRYKAFAQCLEPHHVLICAHHLEDQAETFLLQLFRGAGLKGLSAMADWKELGKGILSRPLLGVSREMIHEYAHQQKLIWVEDHSNHNLRFRRNFVRHQILPPLNEISPSITACIARSARHCANAQNLLEEYVRKDLENCWDQKKKALKIKDLKLLSVLKQCGVVRLWLSQNQIRLPSEKKLADVLHQMLTAKPDANPHVRWNGGGIRRFQDLLYISNEIPMADDPQWWPLGDKLTLADGSVWQAQSVVGMGINKDKIKESTLGIAFRTGGERCRPAHAKFNRSLKKLLNELGVPTWERFRIPLFYYENELVAVGDLFICEGWQVKEEGQEGWLITKLD